MCFSILFPPYPRRPFFIYLALETKKVSRAFSFAVQKSTETLEIYVLLSSLGVGRILMKM